MPPGETPPRPERSIGHYRLLQELGRGAQGKVYLAEDVRLGRRVALKVLASGFAPSREALARFRREAAAASRLDHPGICGIYEAGESDGAHYIAMRYVEGQPLSSWIAAGAAVSPLPGGSPGGSLGASPGGRPGASPPPHGFAAAGGETVLSGSPGGTLPSGGAPPLPPPEKPSPPGAVAGPPSSGPATRAGILRVVQVLEKSARALHAAHEAGLIHRDVKPGNILVTREEQPVILDFGLAREEESELHTLTQSGELLGTPAYMSPEQLLAHRVKLDRRTDVYSLGVTLYECLTGRRPFDAPGREVLYQQIIAGSPPDPARLNPALPRDLKIVLATAMEKDRERRYPTALELAEDLRRVRTYEPIRARPAGAILRFERWVQRNPVLATITLAAFLLLAVGLGVSLFFVERLSLETAAKSSAMESQARESKEKEKALQDLKREHEAKSSALRRAEGLYLSAQASVALPRDPGLALLLSLEGFRRSADALSRNLLLESIRACRELRTIFPGGGAGVTASYLPDGRRILAVTRSRISLRDAQSGKPSAVLESVSPDDFNFAVTSPDGALALAGLQNSFLARVMDFSGAHAPVLLRGHRSLILSAEFSPDGERAATGSEDGTARLWDPRSGECLAVLDGREGRIHSVAFSPDGTRLLTASDSVRIEVLSGPDGSVRGVSYGTFLGPTSARIWDVRSGRELRALSGHHGITVAAWSPDGARVATASEGGPPLPGVRVWDAARGEALFSLKSSWGTASLLAFSPDGGRLLTLSNDLSPPGVEAAGGRGGDPRDDFLHVWDVEPEPRAGKGSAGELLATLAGHEDVISTAAWSPDGSRIVSGSLDRAARIWDARTGATLSVLRAHEAAVISARFSPQGDRVLTAGGDRTARIWSAAPAAANPFAVELRDRPAPVHSLRLAPDGRRLFAVLADGSSGIWETRTGARLARFAASRGPAERFLIGLGVPGKVLESMEPDPEGLFSPDGELFLLNDRGTVQLIEAATGTLRATLDGPENNPQRARISCAAFSPDGRSIATSRGEASPLPFVSIKPSLRIWDAANGALRSQLRDLPAEIDEASFSIDGTRVALHTRFGNLWIREAASGAGLRPAEMLRGGQLGLPRWGPGGLLAAAVPWNAQIQLHNFSSGDRPAILGGHGGTVTGLEFSPDGKRLLSASADRTARIWDPATGEALLVLKGHLGSIGAAHFSAGGLVVTASEDRTARVWDGASGKELLTLAHGDPLSEARFSEGDAWVVTATARGELCRWPIDPAEEGRSRQPRELTGEELDRFEIGSAEERQAYKAQREAEDFLERLEVERQTFPERLLDREEEAMLEGSLARLHHFLEGRPSPDFLERAAGALEAMLARSGGRNPAAALALADLESRRGHVREAVLLLERARRRSRIGSPLERPLLRLRAELLPDLVSFASIDAALSEPATLIPEGAAWRFFRGRSEPSPGLEWKEPEFPDTSWEEGPSGFGYGDDDDATVLADMRGSYTTVYVRRRFPRPPLESFASVRLSVLADDGFVAYLNGTEVGRKLAGRRGARLPFDAVADRESEEPLVATEITLDPALFRDGTNVLALQVLNRSIMSSDLSLIPVVTAEWKGNPGDGSEARRFEAFRALAAGKSGEGAARILYLDARLLELAGKRSEAIEKLRGVLARERSQSEPYLHLAALLRQDDPRGGKGDLKGAREVLGNALAAGLGADGEIWDRWWELSAAMGLGAKAALDDVARVPPPMAGTRGADLLWALGEIATGRAIRIRSGGREHRSPDGTEWGRDRFHDGGSPNWFPVDISGTTDPDLYRSERWFSQRGGQGSGSGSGPGGETGSETRGGPRGELGSTLRIELRNELRNEAGSGRLPGYRVPVPPGKYRLALHFAEAHHRREGMRRFDILIEGRKVLEGYEPVRAGFAVAEVKRFEARVDDGLLDVEFAHGAGLPKISALEVERIGD